MALKATVLLIASGLTGSGIVALTRSNDQPQLAASVPEMAAPAGVTTTTVNFPDQTFQQGHIPAQFAAQRPFSAFGRVTR